MVDYKDVRDKVPNIDDFEESVRRYCTPILNPNCEKPLETEFGNCTLVKIDGHFGVLTAAHVADIFKQEDFLYLPRPDSSLATLKIAEVIMLPSVNGYRSIDIAFIKLISGEEVVGLGYEFYDLSSNKQEVLNILPESLEKFSCAFLATPSEGKREIAVEGKKIIEYPYASFSLSTIKTGSYQSAPFYFSGPDFSQEICDLEFRLDEFQSEITNKQPHTSYKGTSGTGYWGAIFSYKDNLYFYEKLILLGLLVEQQNNILYIRGSVSLYNTFLTFCSEYLKNGDYKKALREASISQ